MKLSTLTALWVTNRSLCPSNQDRRGKDGRTYPDAANAAEAPMSQMP